MVESLHSAAAATPSTGVIVFAVLAVALVLKILLQSSARPHRPDSLRLFDLLSAPLFLVFLIVVLERFRDLS